MDYRFALMAAFLAFSGAVNAGYASLKPPKGWVTGGGGHKPGTFARNPGPVAANDGKWLTRTVITEASLNVGGRAITVPAALRLAANAGVFASRGIFLNPWWAAGIGIASWLASKAIRWNEELQRWEILDEDAEPSDGQLYSAGRGIWKPTREQACIAWVAYEGGNAWYRYVYSLTDGDTCRFQQINRTNPNEIIPGSVPIAKKGGDCPAGWYHTPAGCIQNPPYRQIEEPEFTDKLTESPMPDSVPNELPEHYPLPTELPRINPGPAPDYNPRPFFVPQGDPVPNPRYDPNADPSEENQPYVRPGLNVKPRPTEDAPWNTELQPVDRPSPDDQPNPDPDMNGEPIPGDKPREPKDIGLCDMYPDIVACAKLGQVSEVPVKSRTVPLAIQREEGFGPAEGSCPAPSDFVIMGRSMSFRWDLFCQFAEGVRPVVVGMAYLLAVLAFFGLSRKGS